MTAPRGAGAEERAGRAGGPAPVLLVGLHGHGRSHLRSLIPLCESGLVRLAGVCDSRPPEPGDDLEGHGPVPWFDDLGRAVDETGARITVLVTPIHTHLPLARIALDHGSHLLLEKPTTAGLAEFEQLRAAVDASGLACQVGFQSLGSQAVTAVRDLIAEGTVGRVRGIGGEGAWKRTSAYYDRAPWAGRRHLDGRDVVDGALTNPFAHAVATALAVAGAATEAPRDVELELFHAHPIESDDTSCLRLRTADGTVITLAVTLCAPDSQPPRLVVHGERGRIELDYTLDRVTLHRPGRAPATTVHPRTGLLENLVDHLRDGVPLLVPPEATRGFMHVLEAVRHAPDPAPIPLEHQRVWNEDDVTHRTVNGIGALVHRSAQNLALFSELAPAWLPGAAEATPTTKDRP
ncbi:Gfo/Idh/MocA family oxidoreductase [Streptomonospora nanhaiensis]|uniref:Gfo/Idh/MocA family oxidoreductase n=1 Tax=Streptomonospora nanhaiensis TaxID=1323731 RepID=A0ABY6YVE1_9ACTN|nr:Gfo/Idh/MocA family oxidoreductase [Streptomonospora nanhaiensis]WAE76362.1 Gfo/Idh/MocA family oxidoreductase [Streptomonospora nanhaiensis]